MGKWKDKSNDLKERTEPRSRTKIVKESYNVTRSFVLRESTLNDLDDITKYEGYKSRNALVNDILENYIDEYYAKK